MTRFARAGTARALVLAVTVAAAGCSSPGALPQNAVHVVSRSPAPGATNVWVGEPIQVTFDRAVAASTITDAAVVLAGQGGATLGKTLALSADRKTLTLAPVASPAVPATLTVTLSTSITDDGGGHLALPDGAWSFEVPAWQEPSGGAIDSGPLSWAEWSWWSAPAPVLAMDGSGAPVVAYVEASASPASYRLLVKRWTGAAWEPVGGALNLSSSQSAGRPTLAVGTRGDLFVAWCEPVGDTNPIWTVYVKRWDGTAWTLLGASVNRTASEYAYVPSLTVDADGLPWIAWQEQAAGALPADPLINQVFVKRWTGTFDAGGWSAVGGFASVDPTHFGGWPSLVLDTGGAPVVAYHQEFAVDATHTGYAVYARRFTGTAWETVGGASPSGAISGVVAQVPQLAKDASGALLLTWWENASANGNLLYHTRVRKLVNGTWIAIGDELPAASGSMPGSPSLALDGAGVPFVADDENFAGTFWQVAVRRWTGSAWEAIGGALNHDAAVSAWDASIATDGDGRPWVAWQEGPPGAGPLRVHVKRLNRL